MSLRAGPANPPGLRKSGVAYCVLTGLLLALALPAAEPARELIRDPHFQNGFILLKPQPGRRVVYGELTVAGAAAPPVWDLCQWSSKFPLSPGTAGSASEGRFCFTNSAKRVCRGAAGGGGAELALGVDAGVEYGDHARASVNDPWVHLLVQQDLESPPALTDLSACTFHVEARLAHSRLVRRQDYDPGLHAAQYVIYLTVANRNAASPGFGQYYWFGIPLYDNRERIVPMYQAQDFGDTKMFINTVSSAVFTQESTHDGQWVTYDRDLLPLLRAGLAAGWQRGYMAGSHHEADYRITAIVIGWEVPGVFDVELQIRRLSLRAAMTAATPSEHVHK
ncbi:MAG TPA: hypothetical protein PKN95_04185 [Verrucomicrobiota bacterium]|nr:hypothetical protein [Verrucomicrobiota bacterium]HNT13593.1 hypothetical protein [Verrucomicrobiota bacterium]